MSFLPSRGGRKKRKETLGLLVELRAHDATGVMSVLFHKLGLFSFLVFRAETRGLFTVSGTMI